MWKWKRKSGHMDKEDKTDRGTPRQRTVDAVKRKEKPQGDVVRMHLVFHGEVQGVGFRWRARQAAEEYGITGWIENEDDGTVCMEAQGTQDMIRRMIAYISQGSWVDIRHIDSRFIPVEEHEYYFRVKDYY